MEIAFRALQPVKKTSKAFTIIKYATILLIVGIIISTIVLFLPPFFRLEDDIKAIIGGLIMLLLFVQVLRAFTYVLLKGKKISKYTGHLVLNSDSIAYNDEVFPLNTIEKIRFIGNDIKGDFRGFVGKGIDNQIQLTLKNQEEKTFFFEQTLEHNLKLAEENLNTYVDAKLLAKSNYDSIMNNTNYY